jgi:6-pyruvoyltetrahydropterin/6-carboxytetrahydropterin synthase
MYSLAVRREFIARHFLVGGDWGRENFPNSHRYVLELQLGGQELDQHGYLVDIVEVERHLDELIDYYAEKMLNDLPEFKDLNPSLEHFARILAVTLSQRIQARGISWLKVTLWEHEAAWAAYALDRSAK